MAEMVEEHAHQVYIKDVKFYSTIVTAASEEDAKWKALREHTTLEGYEHLDSSLKFYTSDFFHRTINENDDEPEEILDQLRVEYAELEAENARLKKELSKLKGEPEDESEPEDKKVKKRKATPPVRNGPPKGWGVKSFIQTEHNSTEWISIEMKLENVSLV